MFILDMYALGSTLCKLGGIKHTVYTIRLQEARGSPASLSSHFSCHRHVAVPLHTEAPPHVSVMFLCNHRMTECFKPETNTRFYLETSNHLFSESAVYV